MSFPISKSKSTLFGAALVLGFIFVAQQAWTQSSDSTYTPNDIDYGMYYDSDVRDAVQCAMSVEDGEIVVDPIVTNPALSCADMFAWKVFVKVVDEQFWSAWAADNEVWPKEPLPLCAAGTTGPDCCSPGNADNPGYGDTSDPAYPDSLNCPYFPGDHPIKLVEGKAQPRTLSKPVGAHAIVLGGQGNQNPDTNQPGSGRVIRQEMGEITIRNKEQFDYIFANNLYNAEGLLDIFYRNRDNFANDAPYQGANPLDALTKIDLPIQSITIKSNWLYHTLAKEMGIKEDPDNPFIKNQMVTVIQDEETGKETKFTGEHWLLSFHVSTKDIPQWLWASWEHVNNLGRCDYTGCNDSYGYSSTDANPDGTANNFTMPKTVDDGLMSNAEIFLIGQIYESGPISAELKAILDAMNIGTGGSETKDVPAATDSAWRSYRLKGTQVNYTNLTGHATRLGNSITEGGFMLSSSCVTCHSRAAIGAELESADTGAPLSVFQFDILNIVGYPQSAMGIPDDDWFIEGTFPNPSINAVQADFMWGFPVFAKHLKTTSDDSDDSSSDSNSD